MKMTVKTGDNVVVIAGKDKGKTGKVTAVYADENRVLVENVNIVSKHQKPKSQQDKGGIFKRPAPIDASNVLVVCPTCGKATRVAHSEVEGKKVRSCKKCGASLDKEFVKQTKKEAKKAIKASDLKNAKLTATTTKKEEAKDVKEEKVTAKKTATKKTESKQVKAEPKKTTKKVEAEESVTAEEKPAKKTTTKKTATKSAETKTTSKKSSTAKKESK